MHKAVETSSQAMASARRWHAGTFLNPRIRSQDTFAKGVNYVKSRWRKALAITPLLIAALLICMPGMARAGNVIGLQIQSPTNSSPFRYAKPGGTVTVTARVTVDATDDVWMRATIGTSTSAYTGVGQVLVPGGETRASRDFSVSVTLSGSETESYKNVTVEVYTDCNPAVIGNTEVNAAYVDATPPVVTLGSTPTTPTTNPRPTWTWSGSDPVNPVYPLCSSGLDYYIVALDGELPLQTTSTSFTPSSNLADGAHVLKVKAVDRAGNVGTEQSFAAVTIDTASPPAPAIAALAAGYNTSPIAIDWNDVTDGTNTISYVLEYAGNAGFSGATPAARATSDYSFDAAAAGQGQYWFRAKTISTVNVGETKESAWSPIVSAIYDTIGPAAPVLTLQTPSPTNQTPQRWIWSAPADATGYEVSEDGGTTWADVFDTRTYQTTFNTTGVHPFKVRAYDWLGNKGSEATVNVEVDVTPPDVPTGLTVTTPTTDKTPTWSWTALAGAEGYEIRLDEAIISDVAAATSYTHSEELGDGDHKLEVRSYDTLGNKSAWCAAVTVTVDTTPPAVPGMPTTTSPTNSTTPTWTWAEVTDIDFDYYNVYADGVKVVFAAGTEPTTGSYTSAALTHGMHVLEVTSVDDLGNESAKSTQGHVLIDTEEPSVPVMNPMPQYSQPGRITFSWSVSDDLLEVKYNFQYSLDGGTTWQPAVTGLTVQSYTVNAGALQDGAIVAGQAMAYDAVGNESAYSTSVSTTIDAVAPVVAAATTPTTPTNNATPTWAWSVTETGSGIDYYVVTLDSELPFETTGASFTPSSELVDGPHTLVVMGVDNVGNEGTPCTFATITIDTMASVPGMPTTTSPTNNTTPTWTWAAVGDADFKHYNVYSDGTLAGSVLTNSYTPTVALTHGMHVLEVTSVDNLDNESAKSTQGHVMIDIKAPTTPTMNAMPQYSKPGQVIFSWSASSDDLAVRYRFQYSLTGGAPWTTVYNLTVQSYTVDATGAADSAVAAGRVMAIDAVDNQSAYSAPVSTTIDGTGPTVTAVSPTTPVRDNDATPTWTWSGSDDLSGVSHYIVTLDDELPTRIEYQSGDASFTPSSNLVDGVHRLAVQGVDNVGNLGGELTFEPVTVDTTPPEVPGMPTTTSPTNNTTPTWTWPDIQGAAGDFGYYNVYADGVKVVFAPGTEPTTGSYTSAALTDGTHVLEVTSVDDLGNESARSTQGHVLIDTAKPSVPVINPMRKYSRAGLVTFSWSVSDDLLEVKYNFQYSLDGAITWKPTVEGLTVQSYTVEASTVADGEAVVGRVMAYDAVGNGSDYSASVSTIIDGTGPTVTAVSPTAPVRDNDATPTWTWSGFDGISGVSHYIVTLDDELPNWIEYQSGNTSFTPSSNLVDGVHTLTVQGVDTVGNAGTPCVFEPVTIDTMASVPGMPTTTSPTNNTTPTWTWTAVDDADFNHYNVYSDGALAGSVLTNSDTPTVALTHGMHVLEVTSVDNLGNESARSTQGHVMIDIRAPTTPTMNAMP